jgi:hypothetical protein
VISIRRRVIEPGLTGSLLVVALAASGAAQQVDSARTAARAPNAQARAREEPRPPISPKRAFLYSFLVPGTANRCSIVPSPERCSPAPR